MLLTACGDTAATQIPAAGATAGAAIATAGSGASTAVTGAGDAAATAAAAAGTNVAGGAGTVVAGAGTAAAGAGTAVATNMAGAGTAMATNVAGAGTAVATNVAGMGMTPFDPASVKKLDVEPGANIRISGGGSTAEQDQFRQQLARFSQVYPDVKVQYEPNPEGYNDKLKTQFTSSSEPDVFNFEPTLTDDLIGSTYVMDLTPYLQQLGRSADDYFPGLIAIYKRGDKVYGVPRDFNSLMVFYNTDMVAKTGATAPKAGWTQDDFAAFAKAATQGTDKATKVYGADTEADYARWLPFALANGAKLLGDDKKCAINSAEGVQSLDYWVGLHKQGYSAQAKADLGADWAGAAFGQQRVASAIEGGWIVPFLSDPKGGFSNVKYDAAPLPVGKNGGKGNFLFTNAWGASARSKFPKAAAALVLFLTGKENQQQVLQSGFALPTLKGFESDPFFQSGTATAKIAAINYASGAYGIADYYGPATEDIHKALTKALEQAFAGTDSKTALDTACKSINDAQK
jgi:multiple sugar transport system substrate-binding protein